MSVGLALGDFCGVVAVAREDGGEEVVANADGERYTPSAVGFGEEGVVSVGLAAVQGSGRNPRGTARGFVSLVSASFDDAAVQSNLKSQTCKVVNVDGKVAFEMENHEGPATPKELCSMVLERLWQTAVTQAADAKDVVVAVPIGSSAEHTSALTECAKTAGFVIKQVISEPIAAVLGAGVGQGPRPNQTVLVFDMGASRTTATVVGARGGAYTVLGTTTDTSVSGAACDAALIQLLVKEFKKSNKVDLSDNRKALNNLAAAATDAKHILSTNATTTVFVESLYDGVDFNYKLTRGKFETTVGSVLRKCGPVITAALEASGLKSEDIDQVLLVGGASILPKVGKVIGMMFEGRDVVNAAIPGNEIVALGAARQAYLLRDVSSLDGAPSVAVPTTVSDLCIKTSDGAMAVLIGAGAPLPAARTAVLRTAADNQSSVAVELFAVAKAAAGGDAPAPTPLASAALKDFAAGAAGSVGVNVSVAVAADGTITLELSEPKSGKSVKGTVAGGKA